MKHSEQRDTIWPKMCWVHPFMVVITSSKFHQNPFSICVNWKKCLSRHGTSGHGENVIASATIAGHKRMKVENVTNPYDTASWIHKHWKYLRSFTWSQQVFQDYVANAQQSRQLTQIHLFRQFIGPVYIHFFLLELKSFRYRKTTLFSSTVD